MIKWLSITKSMINLSGYLCPKIKPPFMPNLMIKWLFMANFGIKWLFKPNFMINCLFMPKFMIKWLSIPKSMIKRQLFISYFMIKWQFMSNFMIKWLHVFIPDKKRNAPLTTVQLSGKSQVIGQFSLYQCKGMSDTAASHVFCNLASKLL